MSNVRSVLHSAYSFVRSVETNRAIASLTLDHLLQDQIQAILGGEERSILDAAGESLDRRTSKLDTLDRLDADVSAVVKAVMDAGNDPEKLAELGLRPEPVEEVAP